MPALLATPLPPPTMLQSSLTDAQRGSVRQSRLFTGQAMLDPLDGLTPLRGVVLGLSWLLIVLLGLVPLLEEIYHRPHSPAGPAALAFSIAVSSAAMLRRHYCWLGAALHIAGQVMIWLSIFALTIAAIIL
jgi:apolipoprotein N-acyltransferase